jgi:hypothetical protein
MTITFSIRHVVLFLLILTANACIQCLGQVELIESEKAIAVESWMDALLDFDSNREKLSKSYAVVVETDFAGEKVIGRAAG